jgi:hypothetical protein
MKKTIVFLCLGTPALWLGPLPVLLAQGVSLQVMETGRESEYSRLWENSLMNAFFEAGFIVSNLPAMRVENPVPEMSGAAPVWLEDAQDAGMAYAVLLVLEYQGGNARPHVRARVYRTRDGALLGERDFGNPGAEGAFAASREENARAASAARGLIALLQGL